MPSVPQGYNVFFDIIQEIQDEGIALPFQPALNFIGPGVTAVDDPGNDRTNVTIPGVSFHDFLSATHPDTVPASPVRGDIVVGNATPLWNRLPKGTAGQFLKSTATDVIWDQIDRTDIVDYTSGLLDVTAHTDTVTNPPTEGSLILGNATPAWDELLIGASGQVLTSDGTTASWQTLPADVDFYQTVQDEGVSLAQEPILDFVGAGVTATPGTGKTIVTIPGGGGAGVWEDLANVSPGSPTDLITVTFSPRQFLRIYAWLHTETTGSPINVEMTINGDASSEYASRRSENGASDVTGTNQSHVELDVGTPEHMTFVIIDIVDTPDHQKIGFSKTVQNDTENEFGTVDRQINHFTYQTLLRITSLEFNNVGSGSFGTESIVRVLGYD